MAYSQITINFNAIPAYGEVLNFTETNRGISLNEIFKQYRAASGETVVPTFDKGRYRKTYHQDDYNDSTKVRYTPFFGVSQDVTLGSLEKTNNLNGTFTIFLYSFNQPLIEDLLDYRPNQWLPFGDLIETSYSNFISENYRGAFNLDYNSNGSFTVTDTNGPELSGLGYVVITANYPNAFFVLNTKTVDATVTINNENSTAAISFAPAILSFVHEKNKPLPSKNIVMSGGSWKVVGKPNFLVSSATAGIAVTTITDGSGTYQEVTGSGAATVTIALTSFYNQESSFLPSDLAGAFSVLENETPFGQIPFTVTISRLSDFVITPYLPGEKAFTLDPKFFEIVSDKSNTYFEFNSVIKTYDFFTHELNEYFIPQKIIVFKGKSKVNIGQIIHRLMRKFEKPNDTFLQYKTASLEITCIEKSIVDDSVVEYGTSPEIPFVAGLSRGFSSFGFLEFNPKPNRVTVNSFAYLNMLIPSENYELRTFKNGNLVESLAIPATADHVVCQKVFFNTYAQGDVIEYVLDLIGENNELAPKKTFIVFPEGNYSNMIVWEDEFLVQKAIECTGTASIDSEVEFQSQKKYEDFVEKLEHLSSSKEVKLFINTGWLLFTDTDTVESLMRSKRAWLIQGDNAIALSPIGKKLPKKDLDQELISFPLEFTINRNYDEETYSF